MKDYYRVKFKDLRPPRRSSSYETAGGHERPEMPRLLRIVYVASCVMSGVGWVAAVVVGRGGPLGQFPWLVVPLVAMPFAFVLALGFSEDQRWTRPLIILLLIASATLLAACRLYALAGIALVGAIMVGAYLYTSGASRAYYEFLRETALVRVSLRELWNPEFVPLYVAAVCATVGGVLGYRLVGVADAGFLELGANEAMAVVCGSILSATVAGVLGLWVGDRWLSRRMRSA